MTRRLVVVSAGLSAPSSTRLLADQLADAVTAAVTARGEALTVDTIEVRDLAADLVTTLTAGGLPTASVTRAQDLLRSADAVIAVTPVFSASYSGLFKMLFDVLEPGTLDGTPVLVAATAGTPRHSLVLEHALRPLFSYLHAVVVPTAVFAATEDFGGTSELGRRVARAAAELASLMVAETGAVGGFTAVPGVDTRRSRVAAGPAAVTPFAELLRGHGG